MITKTEQKEHIWIGVWLTYDLEGYICGNCNSECLEPEEMPEECKGFKEVRRTKKKPFVVESRYTGLMDFASWKQWHKSGSYATLKSAMMAIEAKNRSMHGHFEYRLKDKK